MTRSDEIPEIQIGALFEGGPTEAIDRAVLEAASEVGFMTVVGVPASVLAAPERVRDSLLRLFSIPLADQRRFWKRNFASENPNLYRGWFPLESGAGRSREGFEIGPDLVRELPENGNEDLLYEPSVLPAESELPGWRADAAAYYVAMETVGFALLDSLSRGLALDPRWFRDAFRDGISTLRLLRYPAAAGLDRVAPDRAVHRVEWNDESLEVVCGAHVDSGLVTILAQCDAAGLQARSVDGRWLSVPPVEDALVINFGGLLARWTGGRVRATQHRVLSRGEERFSIPFFFEPRPDTVIAPLPLEGVPPFEPFQFGDHLWATTTKFPENLGLEHLRPHRAPYQDPFASR